MNVEDRIDVQGRIPTQVHYIFFKFSLVLFGLCGPWILRSNDGISHFSGIFPLAQGGFNSPSTRQLELQIAWHWGGILRPVQC